jgi:Flp pilus assembly protein TadB
MREAIALGLGVGLGVLGIVMSLVPAREALIVSLRVLDEDPADSRIERRDGRIGTEFGEDERLRSSNLLLGLRDRLETTAVSFMDRLPSVGESLRTDLACTGTGIGIFAERCLFGALAGAVAPLVVWALVVASGFEAPISLPVWVALLGATVGGMSPAMTLRKRAVKCRRQARRSVGCFLDLVVLALAGGLGIEGALHAAAAISDAPLSAGIVGVLEVARDSGSTPWDALAMLGRELGVVELVELASAVSLAGTEGARIKSTLAAKAASIRRHELSDAETEANTVSERLFVPGVLLLVGFLIFIGYPAISRLSAGL